MLGTSLLAWHETLDNSRFAEDRVSDPSELDRATCAALLASRNTCRLVHATQLMRAPAEVPYLFSRGRPTLLLPSESPLVAQCLGTVVAVVVDELPRGTCDGWSVLITGLCSLVNDPARVALIRRVGPSSPLAADGPTTLLELRSPLVRGRRDN
jgi:uncharacterized protein